MTRLFARGAALHGAVTVLSLKQNPNGPLTFYNQHHWETETGDTSRLLRHTRPASPSGVG